MSDKPPEGRERRVYARYDVALVVELEIGVEPHVRRMRGETINIRRGGVLLDVNIPAAAGTPCAVAFADGEAVVVPSRVKGTVVHSGLWKHGRRAVAVQYETPLETLQIPDHG